MDFFRFNLGFYVLFAAMWNCLLMMPERSTVDCNNGIPCENSGICVEENGSISCRCQIGFVGSSCQFRDPCHPSQCQNGATCTVNFRANDTEKPPLFNCTCIPGFTAPLCEVAILNECDKKPCYNGATCQAAVSKSLDEPKTGTASSTDPGKADRFSCICPPGFKGPTCKVSDGTALRRDKQLNKEEDKTTKCESENLCKNGGHCSKNSSSGLTCDCPIQWRGDFCTLDVDECQETPNLCQNAGTCFNHPGGFRCICVNGWEGEHCEINHNDCDGSKCYNGGTCHDRVASFHCECATGYTGLLCHLRDACMSSPCHAGSLCDTSPVDGSFVCSCPHGYQGVDCSQDLDECSLGNPCEHGGKCVNTPGSYRCNCPIGWTGMLCDQNVNECASNPCFNEATCLDDVGRFICLCMPGFTGTHCERNIDDCASRPCQNNGICFDAINNFTCKCPPGYYGRNCEYGISRSDLCASNPCKNYGECIDLRGHYICRCSDKFYGIHCEHPIVTKTTSTEIYTTASIITTSPAIVRVTSASRAIDPVDVVMYDELDRINLARCLAHHCAQKANNGICDPECNYPICGYDGLDCSAGLDPFANCKAKDICQNVFKDGKCNEICNSEGCLFDGFDCMDKTDLTCNPLYETYCIRHLGDGNCDSGCNTRGCNYDGGDCLATKKERAVLIGAVALVLTVDPDVFVNQSNVFLMALGKILDVNLKIKTDNKGQAMVYRWNSRDGVESDDPIKLPTSKDRTIFKSQAKERNPQIFSGVFVVLTVDVTNCATDGRADCFSKVESVANFLGASRAKEALRRELGWDIYSATPEQDRLDSSWARNVWLASVAALLVMIFFLLVVLQRKRKIISKLWAIPGSSSAGGGGAACAFDRRCASGGDDASFCCSADARRAMQNLYVDDAADPMKKTYPNQLQSCAARTGKDFKQPFSYLEEYLVNGQQPRPMDLDQFSESGTYSTYACESDVTACYNMQHKRFKSSATESSGQVLPNNQHPQLKPNVDWRTEHESAAGVLKSNVVFPSNVNVKGPDGQTPVMVAAYSGSDTEDIRRLEYLIDCGADLTDQTQIRGDTALILGVKCCRLQAVKMMLQRGADPNIQDVGGNSAIHHAVSANNVEILSCLLQHSVVPIDLELRNDEGCTPLILAAKNAGGLTVCMEHLLVHKASVSAQDNEGKTALHWCAMQNDVDGIICLLNHGANKDATSQNDQTAVFLAVSEGHTDATLALLQRGASKDMVDDMERSPLQVAQERGYDELIVILRGWQNYPLRNNADKNAFVSTLNNASTLHGAADVLQQYSSVSLRRGQMCKPKPPKRTKSLRAPPSSTAAAVNRNRCVDDSSSMVGGSEGRVSVASLKRQQNAVRDRKSVSKNRPNGCESANKESSDSSCSLVNHKSPMSTASSSSGYGSASTSGGAMSDASPGLSLESSPPFCGDGTPSPPLSSAAMTSSSAVGVFSPQSASQCATLVQQQVSCDEGSRCATAAASFASSSDSRNRSKSSHQRMPQAMGNATMSFSPQATYDQYQQPQQWYCAAAENGADFEMDSSQQMFTVCQSAIKQPLTFQANPDVPYFYPNPSRAMTGGYTHYTTPPNDFNGSYEYVDALAARQRGFLQAYCSTADVSCDANSLQAQKAFYGK